MTPKVKDLFLTDSIVAESKVKRNYLEKLLMGEKILLVSALRNCIAYCMENMETHVRVRRYRRSRGKVKLVKINPKNHLF